jgi:hypothetical protein
MVFLLVYLKHLKHTSKKIKIFSRDLFVILHSEDKYVLFHLDSIVKRPKYY